MKMCKLCDKLKSYWLCLYAWCKRQKWGELYGKYKEWVRATSLGRAADRFIRLFVLTAVAAFCANWVVGAAILPVLQSSLTVAAFAATDKLLNQLKAWSREQDEITKL